MEEIFDSLDKNMIVYNNCIISVIIDVNKLIWFNARDVTIALGYKNPKMTVIKNINKKDKNYLENLETNMITNKHPHSVYINEGGLYKLILTSRLKSSEKFKEWVTHIVLPSIRKYGIYKSKLEFEKEHTTIMQKITHYEKQISLLSNDLKKDDFPEGVVSQSNVM